MFQKSLKFKNTAPKKRFEKRFMQIYLLNILVSQSSPDRQQSTRRSEALCSTRVYQTKVKDLDDLKRHLIDVWADIQQRLTDNTINQWRKYLYACVRARGGHFEHSL